MSFRLHSLLWRDLEIDSLFEPAAEIAAILRFESALAQSQAAHGLVSAKAAAAIEKLCATFSPDMGALKGGITRDGMIVPELVSELRAALPNEHRDALHFRATSQDAIDTCLILQLREAIEILEHQLKQSLISLDDLSNRFGEIPQMGRTRMQRAMPLKVGDRIAAWRAPLRRHQDRLVALKPNLLVVQCGGPIGIDPTPWLVNLAAHLQLGVPPRSWQTARDELANFASWLSLVSGSLGKIGTDIAMMAQNEIAEVSMSDGGRSSAMHHKSNPVQAEILVAIGRYNAALLGGFHQSLIHEQERSGSAWALEWMILPDMASNTGACFGLLNHLLTSVTFSSGVE
jgi:3-carboxy-cis,cis-muconate cycloisomerase